MVPSTRQPSLDYLQLSSFFIRWGSVVIIGTVLLLPRAVGRHGCAGCGQVYVAQHRMTIFISLCYQIVYLLDPADHRLCQRNSAALRCMRQRQHAGRLCCGVSYIKLWASPACDQQRWVQAVWQLAQNGAQAKSYITAKFPQPQQGA